MHVVQILSFVAVVLCVRGVRKTLKASFISRFNQPAHADAEAAWAYMEQHNRLAWPFLGYGLGLMASIGVFVFSLF